MATAEVTALSYSIRTRNISYHRQRTHNSDRKNFEKIFNNYNCSLKSKRGFLRRFFPVRRHKHIECDTRNLEEQCEDAVFEVCDARERYPLQCTEELDKYLQLKNNIAMEPVILKHTPQHFEIPPRVDTGKTETPEESDIWLKQAKHLQSMTDKIQDLKVALKQLKDNKNDQ